MASLSAMFSRIRPKKECEHDSVALDAYVCVNTVVAVVKCEKCGEEKTIRGKENAAGRG